MRRARRVVVALIGSAVLSGLVIAACQTTNANRRGADALCDSDKDCLYGLVCRGAPVGQKGDRHCVYQSYAACKDTSECLPGRICRDGACTVQCVADPDCGAGADGGEPDKCVVGECRRSEERDCLTYSDCSLGEECIAGRCTAHVRVRCFSELDCNQPSHCIGGFCR